MDENMLAAARRAQERLIDAERNAEVARADFHQAVRRLHLHDASLRELAAGLGLSHQRIHQIVESAGGSRRWVRRRERSRPEFACTFCGRQQSAVGKLIAGPGVFICNLCVGVAERVISSGTAADTRHGPIIAMPERDQPERDQPERDQPERDQPERDQQVPCSLCGKSRHQVDGMVAFPALHTGTPLAICAECLELCEEIISERLPVEGPT